mgnify:CR=1 FL=1
MIRGKTNNTTAALLSFELKQPLFLTGLFCILLKGGKIVLKNKGTFVVRVNFTIHAGEAFGLPSIWEAIQWCGADRLGHGVRIIDDIDVSNPSAPRLGLLASYVRDRRIPLELCPSSNVQTGAAQSIADHPIGLLRRLNFRVTINTDNRLMSGTSMSKEMQLCCDAFDWDVTDLRWLTINAMKSAFIPFDERLSLINTVIKPRYADLMSAS